MRYRQLGKDGPEVSAIGLGAWPIGGGMGHVDEQAAVALVRAAIDSGITLVDTAQAYRTSEETLGKALRDGYRDRCFLATKVSGGYGRKDVEAAIENSLRMLGVDCVDLYQVHGWPSENLIEETMEAMARVREQGKARYVGISNFSANRMARALRTARFQSSQPRYNMFDRQIESEDVPFCAREGIGILAHSPLGKGLLTGRYRPGHRFSEDDERSRFPRFQGELFARYCATADRLRTVAQDLGISLVQLAIAWILRLPAVSCVLVGAKTPAQVMEHLGAVEVKLGPEELARIEEILEDAPEG